MVGVFSFLILLCCESATAGFRAALVPVTHYIACSYSKLLSSCPLLATLPSLPQLHSTLGTSTFLLAIATAVSGLTEKAFFELR